ncbi:ATP-binding protein [Leucobacter aridicollis]|uniref:histidine kinase n=1 Tax=Leucobacter aridicollis TaxID=283878 RepID=A0A852R9E5_9MICO|nr:ATP-binding protein [Leucobacter aridicollis]MBL3681500.1 sensor histidine kinase KdpD [Leucobacter aridicollis]NYD27468.1 two-component system sensor histidine kinase KdpD [Leucobacter aridicollis]
MAKRGRLRVFLGAAPGVGKTFSMLEEGRRLHSDGRDVVVAIVESHGRAATAALADGLPTLPRAHVSHRGVELEEMDLAAVLARRPELALVDELAHTNVPGSANEKRWQDVAALLAAGIDVISTLNVQHIESLNDVVEQITGVPQQETVPDSFLRGADELELVDLAPQSLRDRLADGYVYPAERIDAALSHYFRLGNLTALRELALVWLADEVDQALRGYRAAHGIDGTWEARERVVVALTGGPEGDTLLRRGARIAARSSGGELLAVHVTSQDGLRSAAPDVLASQRALVEKLNGSYHQVVGEDVPTALVEFARSVNATQLVLGASRRGRFAAALTGPGIGATVVRESGEIDVHMVNHAAAARRFALPPLTGALTAKRRILGFVVALLGGPILTSLLLLVRTPDSITSDVLSYQLLTVIVALVGGIWPALFAAVFSGLTLDFFFIEPIFTVHIHEPLHLLALGLYVVIASLVSYIVDRAARHTRAARRLAAESELIQTIAGSVLRGDDAAQALADRTREAFQLDGVRVVHEGTGRVVAASGTTADTGGLTRAALGEDAWLELYGQPLAAGEQRLLSVVVAQLSAALAHQELEETAREIGPIAASDRVRGALLTALSHDLRRPLAAATAAVGGLRAAGGALTADDRAELLDTAEESLGALGTLLTDLLDVSRLQGGVLSIANVPTDPAEAIAPALDELGLGPGDVRLALGHDEARANADPVLLQRVIVNLLANALRHSPEGTPVTVTTSVFAETLELRIIDHGPGVPIDRQEDIFVPFQRIGDTDNDTGLGLGLALSRGFIEAMHGTLTPEDTPGGGLTMVIALAMPHPDEVPARADDAAERTDGVPGSDAA